LQKPCYSCHFSVSGHREWDMASERDSAVTVLMLALPETAGSALYGMMDVLLATGNVWQSLVRSDTSSRCFDVRVVAISREPFRCGNRIPVTPDLDLHKARKADIVIVPEMWLGPDEAITGRYPQVVTWLRKRYEAGANCTRPAPVPCCWRKQDCSTVAMPPHTGVSGPFPAPVSEGALPP
jgi:hypothetical protein